MPGMVLVEARGLVKEYGAGQRVVDDVSFAIRRERRWGWWESRAQARAPWRGCCCVWWNLRRAKCDMRAAICWLRVRGEMRAMRRRMQIVFQDPFAALNPRMRVREILAEPFAIHRESQGRV